MEGCMIAPDALLQIISVLAVVTSPRVQRASQFGDHVQRDGPKIFQPRRNPRQRFRPPFGFGILNRTR
jgi:hypothetical protein